MFMANCYRVHCPEEALANDKEGSSKDGWRAPIVEVVLGAVGYMMVVGG